MSQTYKDVVDSVKAAFEAAGVSWSVAAAPAQARSSKTSAGSGGKAVATLQQLSFDFGSGRGGEHGNSLTAGRLVVQLKPSHASAGVNLDALSLLADQGHQAILQLDSSGVRATVSSVEMTTDYVRVTAALTYGSGIRPLVAPEADLLKGRV